MRKKANILDIFVTIISIISAASDGLNLSVFKVLRMFKILRPLRLVARVQTFKVAIEALTNAITNVINVLVISVLFFLVLGIIGVNYFKGQFSLCLLDHTSWINVRYDSQKFSKFECLSYGGEWTTRP